jgi:hypothetical protein
MPMEVGGTLYYKIIMAGMKMKWGNILRSPMVRQIINGRIV